MEDDATTPGTAAPAENERSHQHESDRSPSAEGVTTGEHASATAAESTPPTHIGERLPKVAVVLVGDPDPVARAAARRIDQILNDSETVRTPFSDSLRAALRGEPATANDGLDSVRQLRMSLGLDGPRDQEALRRLGHHAGAIALVIVRFQEGALEALVFDVNALSTYARTLPLETVAESRWHDFLVRRIQMSHANRNATRAAHIPPAPTIPVDETEQLVESLQSEDILPTEEEEDFLESYWPYLVAGGLLAAMITAIAITTANENDPGQPMIRFVPGGG